MKTSTGSRRGATCASSSSNVSSSATDGAGGVDQEARPELEVGDGHPLVRGMDEPLRELRIDRPRGEEAVRDGPERLPHPVRVREARDARGRDDGARLLVADERLDRVPEGP